MCIKSLALTGVAQWVGCRPADQKVPGPIPGQGACLGHRPGPHLGACERQQIDASLTHQCLYSSVSLPFLLSKNKQRRS